MSQYLPTPHQLSLVSITLNRQAPRLDTSEFHWFFQTQIQVLCYLMSFGFAPLFPTAILPSRLFCPHLLMGFLGVLPPQSMYGHQIPLPRTPLLTHHFPVLKSLMIPHHLEGNLVWHFKSAGRKLPLGFLYTQVLPNSTSYPGFLLHQP
jgi:hypothetical protein